MFLDCFNDEAQKDDGANPTSSDIVPKKLKGWKCTAWVQLHESWFIPSIKGVMASKEKEHSAKKDMARWLYNVDVLFNSVKSYYY